MERRESEAALERDRSGQHICMECVVCSYLNTSDSNKKEAAMVRRKCKLSCSRIRLHALALAPTSASNPRTGSMLASRAASIFKVRLPDSASSVSNRADTFLLLGSFSIFCQLDYMISSEKCHSGCKQAQHHHLCRVKKRQAASPILRQAVTRDRSN